MLTSIQASSRVKCGYAAIIDVRSHTKSNKMQSFFLAELVKYLYLLFDDEHLR